MPRKFKSHHDVYLAAVGFNEEDVEANRSGYLSKTQLARLNRERVASLGLIMLLPVVIIPVALFFFVFLAKVPVEHIPIEFVLVFALFGILGIWYSRRDFIHFKRDSSTSEVAWVEGALQVERSYSVAARHFTHMLQIGDLSFYVNSWLAGWFVSGDVYRVYYTAHSHRFLSAEHLSED